MADTLDIVFAPLSQAAEPHAAALVADELALGATAAALDKRSRGALVRAAGAADFKGKAKSAIEVLGQADLGVQRLVLIGAGRPADAKDGDWVMLGGYAQGQITARKCETASLIAELPLGGGPAPAELAADLALGAILRSYKFTRYQTRKPDTGNGGEASDVPKGNGLTRLVVHTADPTGAAAAFQARRALADGIFLARDLVNEPANILHPVEFAERCQLLTKAGVEVEVLDLAKLQALKMGALLGVAQGSPNEPRVVVMHWNGAKSKRAKPLAFLGKGVTFDTGGISIKPSAGMEDMKGDMAGAACVTGLMLALAGRKAPVNAIGIIGLVENMPSGTAMRPGDIVTSMSGQTIEVLNTDAEGRLVLADVATYAIERFKPKLDRRPRHADRCDHRRARQGICRHVRDRRQACVRVVGGRRGDGRAGVADAARQGLRQAARVQDGRHEEHRRSQRRLDHGGTFHRSFHQGHAMGAPRCCRCGDGLGEDRDQPGLGFGLGHSPARPAGKREP